MLYAELHEVMANVNVSQSNATLLQNSWSYAGGFVTTMVVGEYVNTS
jgi:hypothetical protein